MALNVHACRMIAPHVKGRVLCFGVPVVLLTPEGCEAMFGVSPRRFIKPPHWVRIDETPDPYDLFEQLDAELTCVDVIAHDGREVVADLNYPHDFGEFDLVIDAGTVEHCFNIGQAIVNAANAVKVGGKVMHTNPISMCNHGFYNVCPTVFFDFYMANGFKALGMQVRDRNGEGDEKPFHPVDRFPVEDRWGSYFLAKRLEKKPPTYPVQSKYR